jgi:hypothetical protein
MLSRHLPTALLLAVAVALAVAVGAGTASAGTGSSTVSNWSPQPPLYNEFLWSIGPAQTPPGSIPANAVVTAISGDATWSRNAPTGFHYEHAICFGTTSTCLIFPATAASSWSIPYTALPAGFPTINASTTRLIYAARVTDGTNPRIYPAINPPLTLTAFHDMSIYYTF